MVRYIRFLPFALLVGCAMTDQQVNDIANAVQTGVQAVATPVVSVAAPGLDAGAAAGIASAIGLGVAYGVKLLLNAIRKKSE